MAETLFRAVRVAGVHDAPRTMPGKPRLLRQREAVAQEGFDRPQQLRRSPDEARVAAVRARVLPSDEAQGPPPDVLPGDRVGG